MEGQEGNAERQPQPPKKKSKKKERNLCVTHLLVAQDTPKAAQIFSKKLDHYAIKFPLSNESAMKMIEDNNNCCGPYGWQGQQAPDQTDYEEPLWHCQGQGQYPDQAWWEKTCGPLAPDYNALVVANKTEITYTKSSWLILNGNFSTILVPQSKRTLHITEGSKATMQEVQIPSYHHALRKTSTQERYVVGGIRSSCEAGSTNGKGWQQQRRLVLHRGTDQIN